MIIKITENTITSTRDESTLEVEKLAAWKRQTVKEWNTRRGRTTYEEGKIWTNVTQCHLHCKCKKKNLSIAFKYSKYNVHVLASNNKIYIYVDMYIYILKSPLK